MNPLRSFRRHLSAWLALPILAACLVSAGPVGAGADDFEFGRRLAENRYFKQARKVFEQMLADPAAKAETKDLAKFGLATLGYEEAQSASRKLEVPFADVVKLADAASLQILEFAQKNPGHPKAAEALILAGTVKVWIVTWCRELLDDPKTLTDRKTTTGEVQTAARTAVEQAEQHFASLKTKPGDLGAIATYHWTMCQYWRALVFDACSAQQVEALKKAATDLDLYASENDGKLLGIYAQDILGQTFAEQAKCATNDEEKLQLTNKALQWFETCILTEDLDNDTRAVIANGYLHYGQACLNAKRIGATNFLRSGIDMLVKMEGNVPLARHGTGIRAWIVLGDLHAELGNVDAAVKAYTFANENAAATGQQGLQSLAGRRITEVVRTKQGGVTDIKVLLQVANSLYGDEKYEESIPAFRRLIEAAPRTPQGFVDYTWLAWERISAASEKLGDPLSAALVLEGINEAWKDGLIPGKRDDENDKNMIRAGNARLAQASLLNNVARSLGSRTFQELAKRITDGFQPEFPKHPAAGQKETQRAIDQFREAFDAKRANDPTWRAKMEAARGAWDAIAKNLQSDKQDMGWTRLVVIDMAVAGGGGAEAAKAAQRGLDTVAAAFKLWDSAEGKKKLTDFPQLAAQRTEAIVDLRYYRGELLKDLGRWDEVFKEMQDYLADPAMSKHHDDAMALVVEAAIEKDPVQADKLMEEMLRRFPKHPAVSALVSKLAKRYDDQYRELTKQWNTLSLELSGTREDRGQGVSAKLRDATREYDNKETGRVDLVNQVDTIQRRVAAWKKDPALVPELNDLIVKELEEKKLPDLTKRIAETDRLLPELRKKKAELLARAETLEKEMAAIVEQQYLPLKEAVQRYQKGWDSQFGEKPLTADPRSTLEYATRWYFAAKNKRGTEEDWVMARTMLERYLALEAVKALPENDKDKRSAIAKLGRVYSHAAEIETDPVKRAEMVAKAVVMLESNVALRPENNELIVGLLEGRYSSFTWENTTERDRPTYRFIVPKTENVAALKEAIQKLGSPESKVPLPVMGDTARQGVYRKGLNDWKAWLEKNPAEYEQVLRDTRGGGMDVAGYRELANTDLQYRLALASAYTESGNDADFSKCEAVLGTLLRGNLAPEDYSPDWWEATTMTLRLWVGATERWAKQGGAVTAKASTYRQRAKSLVLGRLAFAQVPITDGMRDEWRKLIDRLNKGLASENSPPLDADLDKVVLSGPAEAPPAPGSGAPGAGGPGAGEAPGGGVPPGEAPKEPAPKEPEPKEPTPKEPEPKEPAPKEPGSKEPGEPEPAPAGGGK